MKFIPKKIWPGISLFFIGFTALVWFIIRVVPKPSRASYPCQRAAFPIASAFILWITGSFFSYKFYKKARLAFTSGRSIQAFLFLFATSAALLFTLFFNPIKDSLYAAVNYKVVTDKAESLYAREMASLTQTIVDPKAVVSIVKSDKAQASGITFEDLNVMVRKAVDLAGGFDTLIHEGDLVIIKPNVIAARAQNDSYSNSFPDTANGIATDYRVIQIVVNMVRAKNSTGKIIMIEGSGYGRTRPNIEAIGYNNITGLDSIICLDENITSWYQASSANLASVSLPEGKNLYSTSNLYYLHKLYYDADVVISLPCLKSHFLTGITGGVKNVGIGATPVEMYGNGTSAANDDLPGRWDHINHGDFSTQTIPLDKWIHDFYLCRPVDYVIMDGLQGAQFGPYPGSNTAHTLNSVQKNLRVIVAGKDAVAVDAIEALIAGFDPYKVGHLVLLANDTAGCINPSLIKIKGTQVHEIKTRFDEDNPGKKCQTTDFEPPVNVTLNTCTIDDNTINLSLITGDDVVKVEVAYEDTILDPIIVNNFNAIAVPFYKENSDPENVSVLLYDKYLNCSKLTLKNNSIISGIDEKQEDKFSIYPNPSTDFLNIILSNNKSELYTISVFSSDGKLMFTMKDQSIKKHSLDISSLSNGKYYVKLDCNNKYYCSQFIKL